MLALSALLQVNLSEIIDVCFWGEGKTKALGENPLVPEQESTIHSTHVLINIM